MSIDAFPPSLATTTTDDTLDAIAGLSTSANTMPYFTGVDLAALTPLTPFMRTLLDDPDLATAQATLGITGGGGGAPTDAEYIVGSAHGTLTQERVLTTTPTVAWDLATAGQAKANVPDASITEVKLGLSDVTTQNVSTTAHGLTPKLSGVATEYLSGTGLWTVPPAGTTYTDEQAQDAVGAMLVDTATIDLTYGDGGPTLQADVNDLSITEAKLAFVDVTTKDATTSVHGLLRKLSGTATQYLDGSGAWTTPAGGGTNYWSRTVLTTPSYYTDVLAWWRMEEASGDRVDSVSGLRLVPQGAVANITSTTGRHGQSVRFNGTAGTYLNLPHTALMSAGPNQSFTFAFWYYLDAAFGGTEGLVCKGNSGVTGAYEYEVFHSVGNLYSRMGNGAGGSAQALLAAPPGTGAWHFVVSWFDQSTLTMYLQVNNGTAATSGNTFGSHTSALALEVGRREVAGAVTMNGRIDNVMFWKRTLTTQERTNLYNGGAGVDFNPSLVPYIMPLAATDRLVLAAAPVTNERLEVEGAMKLGTTDGTTDGTLRWTGTDFEGRKGGAWVTLTAAAGQPLDATLTALAGLATGVDQLPYATGTDTFAQTTLTTFARTLLDDTTQAAMRTTLGVASVAETAPGSMFLHMGA